MQIKNQPFQKALKYVGFGRHLDWVSKCFMLCFFMIWFRWECHLKGTINT